MPDPIDPSTLDRFRKGLEALSKQAAIYRECGRIDYATEIDHVIIELKEAMATAAR